MPQMGSQHMGYGCLSLFREVGLQIATGHNQENTIQSRLDSGISFQKEKGGDIGI